MEMNTLDGNKVPEVEHRGKRKSEEVSIGWRNLRFETKGWLGSGNKVILNRLNGCFEYHTLNGFMGPSGAGKTTLLNCLSGNRVQGLTEDSEIFLNKDLQERKVESYFIEQHVEKTMMGNMLVGQILRYAYQFKNGGEGDMERHIRTTIDELLLDEKVLNLKFEQCSGGEQKRIAIAQELMSLRKPTLLFVDEPTTGLDSNAAHLLMQCLKQLATKHRMTVVTSIHVPSDDILNLFDKLYVLAKGGVCIYSGRPQQLRTYLKTEIPDLVIPKEQPPIEVLTEIACSGIADTNAVTIANKILSIEYENVSQHLPELILHQNGVPNHPKQFSFADFYLQLCRMFLVFFKADFKKILILLAIGTFSLFSMSNLSDPDMMKSSGCYPLDAVANIDKYESEEEYVNVNTNSSTVCTNQLENDNLIVKNALYLGNSAIFILLIVLCYGSVINAPFIFIFRNEHRNYWYSLGTFFWSATILGQLQSLLYAVPFAAGGYLLSGQHYMDHYQINWYRLEYFIFYYVILAMYLVTVGQLIGTVLYRRLELSLIVSLFVCVMFLIYSGYFIDVHSSNIVLILWIKDLTEFDIIFKGIVYSIYGLERCNLDREYSHALNKFHVDPTEFYEGYSKWRSVQGVMIKTVLIRLSTLAYMYWKFNLAGKRTTKKKIAKLGDQMKTIDYETQDITTTTTNNNSTETTDQNNRKILITKRVKSEKEIEFEQFSRGKIIVAWRDLSLFGTSLIFERTESTSEECLEQNAILKNLNGQFQFGTLNGLMGTSGAGKTSLLKVLNGRDKTRLSGASQFYLSKFARTQTCFITQDVSGHLLPGLTAKQTLVYASRFKNAQLREFGVDISQIDHQQIALNLLDELDLSDTVDTMVEKCSGGERKRLALAAELTALQMPNLVCIDEPTSGLDSNSAKVVVSCLRKLTQTHSITIVASIHQPNTEVLRMFDQIYVLARGGVCIYSGAPKSILSRLNTVSDMPANDTTFPVETLIKISCSSNPDPVVNQLVSHHNHQFIKSVVDSGFLEQETQQVSDGIQQNRRRFSLEDTWILCQRYMSYIRGYLWKEWIVFLVIIMAYCLFAINMFDPAIATVSGCLNLEDDFNNSCTKTSEMIQEENFLMYNLQYVIVAYFYFFLFILSQSGLSFLQESVFFFNEHRNGWYSSGSFYLCKSLFEIIPATLVTMVYCYFCNIYESIIPGIYYDIVLVMFLTILAYQGFAHLCCLVCGGNLLYSAILGVSLFIVNVMLTNLSVPFAKLHYFYRWLARCTIPSNIFDSFVILQYGFGRCQPRQIQALLYLFSLEDHDYYRCLVAISLIALAHHLLSIGLLLQMANPNENRRHRIDRIKRHLAQLQPTNNIVTGIDSCNDFRIKQIRF